MFDARSWTVWLLAMAVMTMLTRNPVYTLLLLLVARVVGTVCAQPTAVSLQLPLFRIGVIVLLLSTLFNTLSVHVGETVLGRLPAAWPYIGGPLTLEAAVYGAMNGLILLTLLVIFSSFNQIVPTGELIRLAPSALRDLSVVILIAITYLPETSRQLQRIREAQAVRGHQLRGVRDWPPLVLPLLISGLERAMGVAEAMVARGYGATNDEQQPFGVQLALFGSLCAVFSGWSLSFWVGSWGWLLMGGGAAALIALLVLLGRRNRTTQYRARPLTSPDLLLIAVSALAALLLFWKPPFLALTSLNYTPYPVFSFPQLQPVVGFLLLLPLFPALWQLARPENEPQAVAATPEKDVPDDYH